MKMRPFLLGSILAAGLVAATSTTLASKSAPDLVRTLVGPLTAVSVRADTVTDTILQSDATASALAQLGLQEQQLTGFQVTDAVFVPQLTQLVDKQGNVLYTRDLAEDSWVLWFTAPPQAGYQTVYADAVVDALSGDVLTDEVLATRAAPLPILPTVPDTDTGDVSLGSNCVPPFSDPVSWAECYSK